MKIFDGHNDVLTRLWSTGGCKAAPEFLTGLPGHIDLPRAAAGGFGGGFFALWARSPGGMNLSSLKGAYNVPLPPELPEQDAWKIIQAQADIMRTLAELGALRICTSVDQIEEAQAENVLAGIMHLEGAEGIGPDMKELDTLFAMGMRSLGPVWSRPNAFGFGVPFRYPSDGDIGDGLTERGRALVTRCGELGVLIDLSHLNAAGVRDVAEISGKPLVATHSNAHAVSPHARNLTDAQLRLIADSGGVVGVNFERTFVRPDGQPNPDVPVDMVLAHMDHLLETLGEEGVCLGSDYDGCTPPVWLNSVDKLPTLVQAMYTHGYSQERIERICWNNWMRVLRDTWH